LLPSDKWDGYGPHNLWGKMGESPHPYARDYLQRLKLCGERMPQNVDERAKILMNLLDSPPPMEPAVPGWPDNAV
jgi:hypothetical protein